jgi:heme exporter protein A
VSLQRGDRFLFEGLQLGLHAGDVTWLQGANGRGKTSLLRLLSGLSPPDQGVVQGGLDAHTPGLVYIGHTNALKDDLSVAESLRFLARLHGHEDGQAAQHAALEAFDLWRLRAAPVRTLSQGQRRRVALARLALAPQGSVWLLDEPFDALDAAGSAILTERLIAHAAGGGSVLLTSHLPIVIPTPPLRTLVLAEGGAA